MALVLALEPRPSLASDPASTAHRAPHRQGRKDGAAAHLPYLKSCVPFIIDPDRIENLSAKGVWVFECVTRSQGGAVRFNQPLRVRHAMSGKYLSCCTIKSLMDDDEASSEVRIGLLNFEILSKT